METDPLIRGSLEPNQRVLARYRGGHRARDGGGDGAWTVDPQGTNTGQVTVKVHDVPADPVTTLTPGGDPGTVITAVPGQNAMVRVEGIADQRVGFHLTDGTFGAAYNSARVSLLRPDGTALINASAFSNPGTFLESKALPVSGTYTLMIDPQGTNTGQVTARIDDVPADTTATMELGGELVTITTTVPGQNAMVTTDALASGLPVRLRVDQSMHDAMVSVLGPTGQVVVSSWRADWPDDTLSFTSLAGVHTITIDPAGTATGSWRLEAYTGAGTPRIVAPETWSSDNTPNVSWTVDANPAPLGFAVALDANPTTTPEPVVTQTLSTMTGPFADGDHWLHVRAVLSGGSGGRTAHHRLRIDTAPPTITTLTSPTHPDPEAVYGEEDLVLEIAATDGPGQTSGIAGYSINVGDNPFVTSDATIDTVSTAWQTTLPSAGDWWIAVRAIDIAGNAGPAKVFHAQLDATGPAAPIITSRTHPDPTGSSGQRILVASWTPTQGDQITEWSHLLDQEASTVPPPAVTTREAQLVAELEPGTWWLHLRGADTQGRWSETAHFQINVAQASHLTTPRQGETLFGSISLQRDGACTSQDESTHVSITPTDGGPSQTIGPLKVGDECGATWDTTETSEGQPRWPDGDYTLTLTSQGSSIADPVHVTVHNAANTFERLQADYTAGRTTLDDFLNYLVDGFHDPALLPPRYQSEIPLDEEASQLFLQILQAHSGGLTASQAEALEEKLTPESNPPSKHSPGVLEVTEVRSRTAKGGT